MQRRQRKFALGGALIIFIIGYLAYSGYKENRTYSHSLPELYAMKEGAYGMRLQVYGRVIPGSIKRHSTVVDFIIGEGQQTLTVRYVGKDLPDTLTDGAVAFATGTLGHDGLFIADTIFVKSISKDEHAALINHGFAVTGGYLFTPSYQRTSHSPPSSATASLPGCA